MSKEELVIGIDLGTTYSCCAYFSQEDNEVKIIPFKDGMLTAPSVVAVTKKGELIVGSTAKRQAVTNAAGTIRSIKRHMGEVDYKAKMHDKAYSPEEISSYILSHIKNAAEEFTKKTVSKAVITVPAYFNDNQRDATKNAAKIAGIEVLKLINEPTSAALAYGLKKNQVQTVLVYDLGGGTFDVSIVKIEDGIFEVLSTSGNNHLGGDDFDIELKDYIIAEFKKANNIDLNDNPSAVQRILLQCEDAKKELSGMEETFINLPFICEHQGTSYNIEQHITRAKFNQLVKHLIDKTIQPLDDALSQAKLKEGDIDDIIMVGGSTRIPAVKEMVKKRFGKELSHPNPDQVVAHGAAIEASLLGGQVMYGADGQKRSIVLLDTVAIGYGIQDSYGRMSHIITRNTNIPVVRQETYTNAADNQTAAEILVFQGERAMAEDNEQIGNMTIPIAPAPRGKAEIVVEFSIDKNGMLTVSALDKKLSGAQKQTITIVRPSMSKTDIEEAIRKTEEFKAADKQKQEKVQKYNYVDELTYEVERDIKSSDNNYPKTDLQDILTNAQNLKDKVDDYTIEEFLKQITDLNTKYHNLKNTNTSPSNQTTQTTTESADNTESNDSSSNNTDNN